ncbi:MAG: CNNM domain-containing protein [Planctomycetota bacterium]
MLSLLLLYLFLAIGFSFYCSVAEAVLLSITPSFIATLKESRPKMAETLRSLKANIDRPLAAILSLNTIAHTIGAAGVGAEAGKIGGSHYVGIASAVMTLLILIFSEIIPKTIGALYWRALGPIMATTVNWLIILLYPLVWLSELMTKLLSGGKAGHALTRDELTAMAEIGAQQGVLDTHESRVFRSLMRMPSLLVTDVMTPRVVVIAYPDSTTVSELFSNASDVPVSRIPIYRDQLDDAVGFVLKNDLLLAHARNEDQQTLSDFSRTLPIVSSTLSLSKLLERLLENRDHVAIVQDQYGSVVGIVTLEDVMETLLGLEIVDEQDAQVDMQTYARKLANRRVAKMGLSSTENAAASKASENRGNQEHTKAADSPNSQSIETESLPAASETKPNA